MNGKWEAYKFCEARNIFCHVGSIHDRKFMEKILLSKSNLEIIPRLSYNKTTGFFEFYGRK